MNALDIIFGTVLSIFVLVGIWKGFFRQILGLIGIVAGVFFGIVGFGPLSKILIRMIPDVPSFIWLFTSFTIIFIFVYLVCRLLARLLSKLSQLFLLGWLNRLLGGVIGGIKGATIISIILLVIGFLPIQKALHDVRQDSLMYEPLQKFIPSVYNILTDFEITSRGFEKKVVGVLKDVQGKLNSEIIKYFFYGDHESTHAK